ncbi:MAG: hypothetical protein JW699_08680 [Chitinispirillaceae bacterium]|nr:hypothetical protein [Chitinispirillaceae bacterium]
MSLAEVIKAALDQMQDLARTETVIGEPISAGNVTLIPVSRVSIGFAAGGGGKEDKQGSGAGTGGGISVTPVAFISIKDDKVQVHPLSPSDPLVSKIIAAAPDIAKKVSQFFSKKDDSEKEKI